MKRAIPRLVFIVILVQTLIWSSVSANALAQCTSYDRLIQIELELFPYSSIYENTSMAGSDYYKRSLENVSKYPLNSYKLLINAYRTILIYELDNQMELIGNKSAADSFLDDAQSDLSNITQEMDEHTPKTFASLEWRELAKREIQIATEYLNQSKNYYNKTDYNSTIFYLISADSSIHKARGYFYLAMEKDKADITIDNTSNFSDISGYVSLKWIDIVGKTIDFFESIGYEEYLLFPKHAINQSKNYHSVGLYYDALMNAAYAKASIEYYTREHLAQTDTSQILALCELYLNYADVIMSRVYNDPDVDAPFAESTIEQAKLHLHDAEEQSGTNVVAIAELSIQESLIAREQALASLDLKKAIHLGLNDIEISEETSQTDTIGVQYTMLLIIIVETVILIFLWVKRR